LKTSSLIRFRSAGGIEFEHLRGDAKYPFFVGRDTPDVSSHDGEPLAEFDVASQFLTDALEIDNEFVLSANLPEGAVIGDGCVRLIGFERTDSCTASSPFIRTTSTERRTIAESSALIGRSPRGTEARDCSLVGAGAGSS
jgi:hypothetical protein